MPSRGKDHRGIDSRFLSWGQELFPRLQGARFSIVTTVTPNRQFRLRRSALKHLGPAHRNKTTQVSGSFCGPTSRLEDPDIRHELKPFADIQLFSRCLLNPPDWQPGRPVRKVIESFVGLLRCIFSPEVVGNDSSLDRRSPEPPCREKRVCSEP